MFCCMGYAMPYILDYRKDVIREAPTIKASISQNDVIDKSSSALSLPFREED